MLKVKLFRDPDVETAFNDWSAKTQAKIATAQYVLNEAREVLIVFYQEPEGDCEKAHNIMPRGPSLVKP